MKEPDAADRKAMVRALQKTNGSQVNLTESFEVYDSYRQGLYRSMRFWRNNNVADQGPIVTDEIGIIVEQRASETVVTVTGRVTIDSSPYLRSVLLRLLKECRSAVVVIDTGGVVFLDSSGIATLLEALKLAQQRSVKLRLVGVGGEVRMLAEITELATIFSAAGSEVVFS